MMWFALSWSCSCSCSLRSPLFLVNNSVYSGETCDNINAITARTSIKSFNRSLYQDNLLAIDDRKTEDFIGSLKLHWSKLSTLQKTSSNTTEALNHHTTLQATTSSWTFAQGNLYSIDHTYDRVRNYKHLSEGTSSRWIEWHHYLSGLSTNSLILSEEDYRTKKNQK